MKFWVLQVEVRLVTNNSQKALNDADIIYSITSCKLLISLQNAVGQKTDHKRKSAWSSITVVFVGGEAGELPPHWI